MECHPERSERSGFSTPLKQVLAPARTEVPRLARDDKHARDDNHEDPKPHSLIAIVAPTRIKSPIASLLLKEL